MKNLRTFLLTLSFFGLSISAAFSQHPSLGGGAGTDSDPYIISTGEQLKALADYVNDDNGITEGVYYKLTNDLDLSGYAAGEGWLPIGVFRGIFDGNNHKITGLKINRLDLDKVALFGILASTATIKNFGIEECYIKGRDYVGGLVAQNSGGFIENCYATGNVTGQERVGGLVGINTAAFIEKCYSTSNVTGQEKVGGLVGENYVYSSIERCYATGCVKGIPYVGGLVGVNTFKSSVKNSYATGCVTGEYMVGGLVGDNDESYIENCYATGSVTGSGMLGGLVGRHSYDSSTKNCIAANNMVKGSSYRNRISGYNYDGDLLNNYALSTMVVENMTPTPDKDGEAGANASLDQLQSLVFYTTSSNWNTSAGKVWDIIDPSGIWMICDGKELPFLRWQGISCEGLGNSEIIAGKNIIYPNPAKDALNFSLEASYELIDLQGRLLKSGKSVKTINISSLPSGVYFIRLITETGVSVQKVIKE